MTHLQRRYGARWAFFMSEAERSLELARTAPTRALKRMWLAQAESELARASEAAGQ